MNELQRQVYLSALGIDTYMPRWQLPSAPLATLCELPEGVWPPASDDKPNIESISASVKNISNIESQFTHQPTPVNDLIGDIFASKKQKNVVPALEKFIPQESAAISPFSLSVWRPIEGLMIVDSRNAKLALPTDALLKNIFRQLFRQNTPNFKEEIIRCPMIENSFAKRTADDARAELQTWFSVQCEIKPVQYLWLLGENAFSYLLADKHDAKTKLWQGAKVADSNIEALILPSLNELLINPVLKKSLLLAVRQYHF